MVKRHEVLHIFDVPTTLLTPGEVFTKVWGEGGDKPFTKTLVRREEARSFVRTLARLIETAHGNS
jgi:hypothetical protein